MQSKYYYLVMSQKEMLENQIIEEVLRERASHYLSKSRFSDFWILITPDFITKLDDKLRKSNFFKQQKELLTTKYSSRAFYSVLITTNKEFFDWIKLRIGSFENIDDKIEQNSYTYDGVFGELLSSDKYFSLKSNLDLLHPDIVLRNYNKILDLCYK